MTDAKPYTLEEFEEGHNDTGRLRATVEALAAAEDSIRLANKMLAMMDDKLIAARYVLEKLYEMHVVLRFSEERAQALAKLADMARVALNLDAGKKAPTPRKKKT